MNVVDGHVLGEHSSWRVYKVDVVGVCWVDVVGVCVGLVHVVGKCVGCM